MKSAEMIEKIKTHPQCRQVGMILTHTGIVRGHSRDGKPVRDVEVRADRGALAKIIEDVKARAGIIEVLVAVRDGRLRVGEEIMNVAVSGDIRENVFSAL